MVMRVFSLHVAFAQIQYLVRLALLGLQISVSFVKMQLFVQLQFLVHPVLLDLRISAGLTPLELQFPVKIEFVVYAVLFVNLALMKSQVLVPVRLLLHLLVKLLVWSRPPAGPRLTRRGRSWARWAALPPPCWLPCRRHTSRPRTSAQVAACGAPCPCSRSALATWHCLACRPCRTTASTTSPA